MKYRLHYEYRSVVTEEVEADSKEEAEALTIESAGEQAANNLTSYSLDIEEID